MPNLTLSQARTIIDGALAHAHAAKFKPLGIVVLDARGTIKASVVEDNTSLRRFDIAKGKADGAVALGVSSRTLSKMAQDRPHFVSGVTTTVGGSLVPVPGAVLIRDGAGALLGAVGVSGDTSDNDEEACVAGIKAAGLQAEI